MAIWASMDKKDGKGYPCACCGCLTLSEPDHYSFEICPVCGWEDDRVQFRNPDKSGGANSVSLNQARENFRKFKTHDPNCSSKTRDPLPEEIPK